MGECEAGTVKGEWSEEPVLCCHQGEFGTVSKRDVELSGWVRGVRETGWGCVW